MNTILYVVLLARFAYEVQTIAYPCNWNDFNGRFYHISTNTAVSWLAARASCRQLGGDLAVPTSGAINQHIYLAIKQRNIGSIWIGLYRVAEGLGTKKFYTVRGVEPSYLNWYITREPNDHEGHEDCAELVYKRNYKGYNGQDIGGKWNDLACSKYPRHYVCEMSFLKYDN